MLFLKPLSILLVSCVPFLFSLNGDFVFDDSEAIVKNKDVTVNHWKDAFLHDFWGADIQTNISHKSYRPLTILSFKLNYMLSGNKLNAVHFKVVNLLCHMGSCILLWLALEAVVHSIEIRSCFDRSVDIPYLAALLFASHPIHVEAVSGIVGRADILASIVFFTGLLTYYKAMTSKAFKYPITALTITLGLVSMFFKENGVTLLGVCIIWEMIIKLYSKDVPALIVNLIMRRSKEKFYTNGSLIRLFSVLMSSTGVLQLRLSIMAGTKPLFKPTDNPAYFSGSFYNSVLNYNYIYFLNAVLLVWPNWLCYDWSMGCVPLLKDIGDMRSLGMVIIYAYGFLIIKQFPNEKVTGFTKRMLIMSVSLVVIPFLPASNILFPVGFVIAERILYIPSAGYCLLISLGINKIVNKGRNKFRKITMAFFYGLIFVNGLRCWQRSYDWKNERNLFISGLSVCPLNAKVHYNVAKVADAEKNTEWALKEYKEALRLYPEYYQAMNNLGNLLKSQKKYTEAEQYLKKAIGYKQDFPTAWMNLGIVLASTKRYDEARKAYKTALHYHKNYVDCYYNLGNLYLDMNKTNEALNNWFLTIRLKRTHILAWTNILALLDNTGQLNTAIQLIPKVLKAVPNSPSICFAIANIYGKMEKYEEAEKYFKKALKLFGVNAQALHYANLGVLYHRWKHYTLAEEMYEKALAIDPTFTSAKKNLMNLKKAEAAT